MPKSAGEARPVLVVPANKSVLHIAVDLPKGTNLGNGALQQAYDAYLAAAQAKWE